MNEKTVISPPREEFMDMDEFYMFSLGDNTEQLSGRLFNSVEECCHTMNNPYGRLILHVTIPVFSVFPETSRVTPV